MLALWAALLVSAAKATHLPGLRADLDSCLSAAAGAETGREAALSLLQLRAEPQRAVPRTLDSVLTAPGGRAQLLSARDPGHYVSANGGDATPWHSAQSGHERDFQAPSPQAIDGRAPFVASEKNAAPAELRAAAKKAKKGATMNPFHTAAAEPIEAPPQPATAAEPAPKPLEAENPFDTAAAEPIAASAQPIAPPAEEPDGAAVRSNAPLERPAAASGNTHTANRKPAAVSTVPIVVPATAAAASTAAMPNGVPTKPSGAQARPKVPQAMPTVVPAAKETRTFSAAPESGAATEASVEPPRMQNSQMPSDSETAEALTQAPEGLGNKVAPAVSSNQRNGAMKLKDPFSDWLYTKDGTKSNGASPAEAHSGSADSTPSASKRFSKQGIGGGSSSSERSGKSHDRENHKNDKLGSRPKLPHIHGLEQRGDGDVSVFTGEQGSFVDLQDFPGDMGGPNGFSVAFDAAWLEFGKWGSIIDFGSGDGKNNIVVSNTEDTDGLSFHVYRHGHVSTVDIKHVIELKTMNRYLCAVSRHGEMKVYKDGRMIGHRKRGNVPAAVKREHLLIGKSNWNNTESGFHGVAGDLCIWNEQVTWREAADCITSSSSNLLYSAHILPGIMASNPGIQ